MPILSGVGTGSSTVLNTSTTVQAIVDATTREMRNVIGTQPGDPAILLDWTNRVQLALLRASRWVFLRSEPFYFITQREQTDYYIGPEGQAPPGIVDTQLNLNNIDMIARNSVRDVSNDTILQKTDYRPFSMTLSTEDAQFRPGRPAEWAQDLLSQNVISIYPAPDNQNSWQPIPQTPYLTITPGGNLTARTYLVQLSFVDSLSFEGSVCAREGLIEIPAGFLMTVNSPNLPYNITASGVSYNQYNVYAVAIPTPNSAPTFANTETLQTVTPAALGNPWTEPTTGLTTTGRGIIAASNVEITTMDGYLVEFRYFEARQIVLALTDVLQVPDVYKDIVVAGVCYYACKYLRLKDEAQEWFMQFQDGIRQIIKDQNLFPQEQNYIAADIATIGIGATLSYIDTFDLSR